MNNLEVSILGGTVAVFSIIVLQSFYRILYRGDDKNKTLQKLIGGLSVFIFAILSKNGWVQFTALFIGGLIIASEEFMKSLAAILRSKSDDLPKVLEILGIQKLSKKEKIEKNEKEKKETKKIYENLNKDFSEFKKYSENHQIVEKKVLEMYQDAFSNEFTPQVKLEDERGVHFVDGVFHEPYNNKKVYKYLEIKYYPKIYNNLKLVEMGVKNVINQFNQRTTFLPIVVIVVSTDISKEFAERTQKYIKEKFNTIDIVFFNIDNKGNLFTALSE